MNDFRQNIAGFTGVVKPKAFTLPAKPTLRDLSFSIESGPGCSPEPGTRRAVRGKWLSDNATETLSSYDFEYVLDKDGNKISRTPDEVSDVPPVKLASEVEAQKTITVRRKRG